MTGGKSYWKNAVLTNGKILVLWKEENVKKKMNMSLNQTDKPKKIII
jgi:hypothetical protein